MRICAVIGKFTIYICTVHVTWEAVHMSATSILSKYMYSFYHFLSFYHFHIKNWSPQIMCWWPKVLMKSPVGAWHVTINFEPFIHIFWGSILFEETNGQVELHANTNQGKAFNAAAVICGNTTHLIDYVQHVFHLPAGCLWVAGIFSVL